MSSSRVDAVNDYNAAVRQGQKYVQSCLSKGEYPYMQSLEELMQDDSSGGSFSVGTTEIPIDRIVGSVAKGRTHAFAGNFMPLLSEDTEFASKWIALYEAHLDKGISDPILVTEYRGSFYVQEGHKRVSVLRFLGALSVRAAVVRMMPAWEDSPETRAYFEFVQFYKLSGTYAVFFDKPGCYAELQQAMGFSKDHVWTEEERRVFSSVIWRFREVWNRLFRSEKADIVTLSGAFLQYLALYRYDELTALSMDELYNRLTSLLPQFQFMTGEEQVAVSMEPESAEKGVFSRLLEGITRPTLNAAFIYASSPDTSNWFMGHEQGRVYAEKKLGARVSLRAYTADGKTADEAIEQAISEGAQVLFVTAPTMLSAARRAAAEHQNIKVLVCALSVPYAGVRTYYSRIYEAKFITGAIAGSVWTGGSIGYIARYPILGEPASINAFALGVRMTAPNATVHVAWTSLPGDPWQEMRAARARIISWQETALSDAKQQNMPMSTVQVEPDGSFEPLASACWNWGKLYRHLLESIINGAWDAYDPEKTGAVNYWWGMDSGVIDIALSPTLPEGTRQLALILREDLKDGVLFPFGCKVFDQAGNLRCDGEKRLLPEEIMRMNWLCQNVSGRIPEAEELLTFSRETTRLLALPAQE